MRRWACTALLALLLPALACRERPAGAGAPGRVRLVLKYQPLWGSPEGLPGLLEEFRAAHPGVELVAETLPNASDLAHQFFLTALEGGSHDFDVFVLDVVWVAEFARAGWVADLTEAFPPETLSRDFLAGPLAAVVQEGRTWALPWYVDVGLLYFRTDLVPHAPSTYAELTSLARAAQAREPHLAGYVWQGRQYEGLTCNVYEVLWGHGGRTLAEGGRLLLDTPEARAALGWMRGLLTSGVSPPGVSAAAEEEARRLFQEGRAVFMRNWPYAWAELQAPGSPVRGRVGVAPLPTLSGEPGAGALGGWQLALNRHSLPERREAALALLRHLTSPEANLRLALHHARNPARRSVYADERLRAGAPFIASLLPAVERARPRPVTPYYNLLADVLQGEFSAALTGLRPPAEALARAQAQVDRLTREGR